MPSKGFGIVHFFAGMLARWVENRCSSPASRRRRTSPAPGAAANFLIFVLALFQSLISLLFLMNRRGGGRESEVGMKDLRQASAQGGARPPGAPCGCIHLRPSARASSCYTSLFSISSKVIHRAYFRRYSLSRRYRREFCSRPRARLRPWSPCAKRGAGPQFGSTARPGMSGPRADRGCDSSLAVGRT